MTATAATATSATTAAAAGHRRLLIRRALLRHGLRPLLRLQRAALRARLDRRVHDAHDRREQTPETGEHLAVSTAAAAAAASRGTTAAIPAGTRLRRRGTTVVSTAVHARERG
jgi:hypothetical protein